MFKHLTFWFSFQPGRVLTSQPMRWLKSWKWFGTAGRVVWHAAVKCRSSIRSARPKKQSAVSDAFAFFRSFLGLLVDGCPKLLWSFLKLFFTLETCPWPKDSSEVAPTSDTAAQHSATLRDKGSKAPHSVPANTRNGTIACQGWRSYTKFSQNPQYT